MTEPTTEQATTYTVLFVDDEPNILRAIKRALFTMDITLLLADSGAKALDLMSKHDVHVVISDMKMPQMSGAELLEQVAINYPETFRVVLTGYADIESTIKAVNQGKIHRYLQKPWDNQELIAVVEEGLERVKLKAENLRLQKLTRLQNKKLRDVNASLEQVVQKRTRQIKAALNKIEKHNLAMEQVLFNVISINPDINGKFAIEGLTYRQAENRYISLTANKSDSDLGEDDGETFVGVDMQWALSTRTRIAATYGRRFYGESASANISYNSKYLRTSFSYSEDVTNTSRLLADPENLGVFVCPASSTSIADCFQPNSLSYTPSAGEQLVQLTSQNLEFDDNIILRKSANFQAGYDFSRITLAFSWRYAEDDYLDEDRLRRTYSFGTNVAYKIGSYTNITSSINYANITGQGAEDVFRGESDNWNASIGLEREFGRRLKASIDARYLKQEGDLNAGGQFGNNYTDRRLSASITYTYD